MSGLMGRRPDQTTLDHMGWLGCTWQTPMYRLPWCTLPTFAPVVSASVSASGYTIFHSQRVSELARVLCCTDGSVRRADEPELEPGALSGFCPLWAGGRSLMSELTLRPKLLTTGDERNQGGIYCYRDNKKKKTGAPAAIVYAGVLCSSTLRM